MNEPPNKAMDTEERERKKKRNRVRSGESHQKARRGVRRAKGREEAEGGAEGRMTAHWNGTSGPVSFISVPNTPVNAQETREEEGV